MFTQWFYIYFIISFFVVVMATFQSAMRVSHYLKPLIHGQVNLIKFIASNKFDNVTVKFDTFLFDQISLVKSV